MSINTVNRRLLIAATMVAVAVPSIASAGPGSTIEATVITSGKTERVTTIGGAEGYGQAGPFGLAGKGGGRFGNKETTTTINSLVQEGGNKKISGTYVLGTDVGGSTNVGGDVRIGSVVQK